MPAVSKAQGIAAAIAEHHPGELYARNKAMLGMTHEELHKFAATKRKKLPAKVKQKKPKAGQMNTASRAKR
jgi:hypothetical protein